jgi:hypothetical protein
MLLTIIYKEQTDPNEKLRKTVRYIPYIQTNSKAPKSCILPSSHKILKEAIP